MHGNVSPPRTGRIAASPASVLRRRAIHKGESGPELTAYWLGLVAGAATVIGLTRATIAIVRLAGW